VWELWARVCDSGGDSEFFVAESFGLMGSGYRVLGWTRFILWLLEWAVALGGKGGLLPGGELGMGARDILIGTWMQWRQGVLDAGGINWQSRHHT
jgi:hypothetical protein